MQTTIEQLTPSQREKIVSFLKEHPVGVLATVDAEGNPDASAIYIMVDSKLQVTFTTKRETNKYKNIAHHNQIILVVYEAKSQTVVQIRGQAIEVEDPEVQHEIYRGTLQAAKKTGEDVVPPVAKIAAGPYVGFTIKVDNIRLSEFGWGDNFANALEHAADRPPTGDPA